MNTTELKYIEKDQRFLLAAAFAYNTGKEWIDDAHYDACVAYMQRIKERYPVEWSASSIYPEIFIEDDAWTYTSMHFPQDEVVKGWYEDYRSRNG